MKNILTNLNVYYFVPHRGRPDVGCKLARFSFDPRYARMETKHSRRAQSFIRQEGEKVYIGTASELANLQTERRTSQGLFVNVTDHHYGMLLNVLHKVLLSSILFLI